MFFRRQGVHLFFIVVLVPVAFALAAPVLGDGEWLGVRDRTWFAVCIGLPVVHQVYIWFAWRAHFAGGCSRARSARPTSPFTTRSSCRCSSRVRCSSARSARPMPTASRCPSAYTGWSVARYFRFLRASGGDHFRQRYREGPLVTAGAFAWTPNAMYTFAFLGLWAIALFARSHAALVAALFQHAYIWVHYVCTEQPDMEVLHPA